MFKFYITEKYVDMCSNAVEMQESYKGKDSDGKQSWASAGDFVALYGDHMNLDMVVIANVSNDDLAVQVDSFDKASFGDLKHFRFMDKNCTLDEKKFTWLPRQEQIQQLLLRVDKSLSDFEKFSRVVKNSLNENYYFQSESWEEVWLKLYMNKHHTKRWSDVEKKWLV